MTDAERKGYGEVWNPKAIPFALREDNFSGVNWRRPNAWGNKFYPDSAYPNERRDSEYNER